MDADEFLKQVRPAARQSKLAPHLADIRKLRSSGCTLEQVCEFLEKNGVTVSVAGLSAYLRRQDGKQVAGSGLHNPQTATSAGEQAAVGEQSPDAEAKPAKAKERVQKKAEQTAVTPSTLRKASRNDNIDLDSFIDGKEK